MKARWVLLIVCLVACGTGNNDSADPACDPEDDVCFEPGQGNCPRTLVSMGGECCSPSCIDAACSPLCSGGCGICNGCGDYCGDSGYCLKASRKIQSPCSSDKDCDSGICLPYPYGFCTQECSDDNSCPEVCNLACRETLLLDYTTRPVCTPFCGDGKCCAYGHENHQTCPEDCGPPTSNCVEGEVRCGAPDRYTTCAEVEDGLWDFVGAVVFCPFGSICTCLFNDLSEPICAPEEPCIECAPDCTGRDCGGDGCGGSCGVCGGGEVCVDGVCG